MKAEHSELLKWLGVVAMVIDHANSYLLDGAYPWMYQVGRLALPLFAFSLGCGLGSRPVAARVGVMRRLLGFALVAQLPAVLVRHDAVLNVLFTLFLGVAFHAAFLLVLQARRPGVVGRLRE